MVQRRLKVVLDYPFPPRTSGISLYPTLQLEVTRLLPCPDLLVQTMISRCTLNCMGGAGSSCESGREPNYNGDDVSVAALSKVTLVTFM